MRRWLHAFLRLCILLAILAVVGFFFFRRQYHNAIRTLAESQVRNVTSDLINDAVSRQIASGNIQYDRIVYFEKDLNGRIMALKTNMTEVNRLKTEVLDRINEDLLAQEVSNLGIPIGSLLLPEFLSGKGPELPVRILSIRNSNAEFTSAFTEAGINQTLQRLIMKVDVDVAVLVLGEADSFTVSSQVVVAETIIVGQVPDTFLNTGG